MLVDFNLTKKVKIHGVELTFKFCDDNTVTITGNLEKFSNQVAKECSISEADLKALIKDRNFIKEMITEMNSEEIKEALEKGTFTDPQRIQLATTLTHGVKKIIVNLKSGFATYFGGPYSGYAEKNSMMSSILKQYAETLVKEITSPSSL